MSRRPLMVITSSVMLIEMSSGEVPATGAMITISSSVW